MPQARFDILSQIRNLVARISMSGPFMALRAAGGVRPGVYAGYADFVTPVCGRPGWRPSRRPVNGPDNSLDIGCSRPGVNAGPSTACGGKGRKRPCLSMPAIRATARQSSVHSGTFSISDRFGARARTIGSEVDSIACEMGKGAPLRVAAKQKSDVAIPICDKLSVSHGTMSA
jgi:hypothetical protein